MLPAEILSQYIVTPLTLEEIDELESDCQRKLPEPIRQWLATVGAPQNVCYRLPENESRFITMQQWTPAGYFAFASDEDLDATFVLDDQANVYMLQLGSKKPEPVSGTFVEYVLANLAPREPIEEIKWHTQLAFQTDEEDIVLRELSEAFSLTDLGGWQYQDTSPAEVITYTNSCVSPNGDVKISRQEYNGWDAPIYYFNREVDIAQIRRLKSIFRRFEKLNIGFKLIDYGLLAMGGDDNEEEDDDY
ncbi:SMI1/KNR4 family protein [Blastopirellula retiformator]|uniref:Knr4/Smi1-like domain-containing protein n=1 Tax=Blastopirellula retiformator TaxID=2527970 RepID=A0A5C5UYY9_9BACT|nr:SMI1/KNR4 family protein [Blastopirellula retiformator]TWT31348.1 hypothetical protein Enr8_32680 [Blastopirellula retiformator]